MVRYGSIPRDLSKLEPTMLDFFQKHKRSRTTNRWIENNRATHYSNQVLDYKRAIPFIRFNHSIGRTAQAKEFEVTLARKSVKSFKYIEEL